MEKIVTWQEHPETIGAGKIVQILFYHDQLIVACERGMFTVNSKTDEITQIRFKIDE
jgi:hypothetical protein